MSLCAVSQGAVSQGRVSPGGVSQGRVSQARVSQGAVSQGVVSQSRISPGCRGVPRICRRGFPNISVFLKTTPTFTWCAHVHVLHRKAMYSGCNSVVGAASTIGVHGLVHVYFLVNT